MAAASAANTWNSWLPRPPFIAIVIMIICNNTMAYNDTFKLK
jgi:hypothetical protein